MDKNPHKLSIQLWIAGFIMGAIGMAAYFLFDSVYIIMILANIFAVGVIFLYINQHVNKSKENAIKELVQKMKEVGLDSSEPLDTKSNDPILEVALRSVESLRQELHRQTRMRTNVLKVVNSIALNLTKWEMVGDVLMRMTEVTNSNWGAFYYLNSTTEKLELKASIGFSRNIYKELDASIGEGLLGKSILSKRIQVVRGVPDDSIFVSRSFLGKVKPKNIVLVPILSEDDILGLLLLGCIHDYTLADMGLIKMLRHYIGIAVSNSIVFERTERMSKELRFQNNLIQKMNEELEDKINQRTLFQNMIIDNMDDFAIVATDERLRINTWNRGAMNILGFAQEEVMGQNILDLMTFTADHNTIKRNYRIAVNCGEFVDYYCRTRKDGASFLALLKINPIYDQIGELIGFTHILKYKSEDKRLEPFYLEGENKISPRLRHSKVPYVLTDIRFRVLDMNVVATALFNAEENLERYFTNPKDFNEKIEHVMETRQRFEWEIELSFGKSIVSVAPLYDDNGVLLFFMFRIAVIKEEWDIK